MQEINSVSLLFLIDLGPNVDHVVQSGQLLRFGVGQELTSGWLSSAPCLCWVLSIGSSPAPTALWSIGIAHVSVVLQDAGQALRNNVDVCN